MNYTIENEPLTVLQGVIMNNQPTNQPNTPYNNRKAGQTSLLITFNVPDNEKVRNNLSFAMRKQLIDFLILNDLDYALNPNLVPALTFSMGLSSLNDEVVFVFDDRGRFKMFVSSQDIRKDNPISKGKYAV